MRSLLIKASIVTSLVLSLGSGITLASASSKPGMFLYPVKQTTQKAIGTFTNITAVEIPIAVPSQTPDVQEAAVPQNSSVKGIQPDAAQVPADIEGTEETQGDEAAETAPRTPVAPPQAVQRMDDTPGVAEPGAGRNSAMDMITLSASDSSQNSSDPTSNQTADIPDHNSQDNSSPTGNSPDNSSYDDSQDSNSSDNSQDNGGSSDDSQDSNSSDNSQDNSSYDDNSQDNSSHDDSQDSNSSDDSQDSNSSDNSQDNNSYDNSQDNSSYDDNSQDSNSSDNSQDNSSHDDSQDSNSSDNSQDNSNSHDNQSHDEHGTD